MWRSTPTCPGLRGALGFLGIALEEKRHTTHAGVISTAPSQTRCRVMRTDEAQMIARSVDHAFSNPLSAGRQPRTSNIKYERMTTI
jgi:hypothetical protein